MPQPQNGESRFYDIYIDESSQTQNRYLALGGIIMPTHTAAEFEQCMRAARLPELPSGELKWGKVSASKLPAYQRVAEWFLTSKESCIRAAQFHSIVVDTHKIKDKAFNGGSREIGFNKEIYQLCQKFGRIKPSGLFNVYLDERETKSSTNDLKTILNHGIRKKFPSRDWPYRRVHFRNSSSCLHLQIVDILLGAVAFRINGHRYAPHASKSKSELSDLVLSLAGIRDASKDTATYGRFTVWHRVLR
ncbi:DUF3800 domain-containing protein [Acetobacteraceae bacterium H6797]|nr:DUF3800 domain-containing protein [Acetobacteraceae bacterium H6797]